MEYLWSSLLYLLFLIPILILAYVLILRRRKPYSVRFSSLSLIRSALPKQSQWKRHVPFVLFLLAMSSLIMALARPTSTVTLPSNNATIILALDVSRSMCSTDIAPNRLEAAKAAALQFIESQDANTQIGIVAFAGFAVVAQPPTTDRDLLETAITNLTTARRTAIGEGILMSLDLIAEFDDSVVSPYSQAEFTPIPEGQYVPAIIVLLTDGVTTTGIHPIEAAIMAQQRGVRVYTIGFGTANNTSPMNCSFSSPYGFDQFTDPQFFGGGGGGGGGQFRREIDEETLKIVSGMTGGEYHLAESSAELQKVFDNLPTQIFTVTETTEISVFFVIFAAVFILLAIVLAIIWNPLL
ncbi:MAG: VWA domain-containing protein [Anaerolineales bacterium]|nr:VWA domain-containing protein [Anaerolineales bacterium]